MGVFTAFPQTFGRLHHPHVPHLTGCYPRALTPPPDGGAQSNDKRGIS